MKFSWAVINRGGCRKMKGGVLDLASLGLMPQVNFLNILTPYNSSVNTHCSCFITMPFWLIHTRARSHLALQAPQTLIWY